MAWLFTRSVADSANAADAGAPYNYHTIEDVASVTSALAKVTDQVRVLADVADAPDYPQCTSGERDYIFSNFIRLHATFWGTDEEPTLGLTASTGLTGPQIFLVWNDHPLTIHGLRIVRQRGHYPQHADDGVVVYESGHVPGVTYFADTDLLPRTTYYYRGFALLEGSWEDVDGNTDWAFSGDDLLLEETEFETTVAAGYYLGPNCIALGLTDFDHRNMVVVGRWLQIGTKTPIQVRVTAVTPAAGTVPLLVEFEKTGWVESSERVTRVDSVPLTFTYQNGAFSNRSTIYRDSGSFVNDGYLAGMPVRAIATKLNDGEWLVDQVYAQTLVLAASEALSDEGPVSGARIEGPPGKIQGERVVLLRNHGPYLPKKIYRDLIPDGLRDADRDMAAQGLLLTETELSNGQVAGLGEATLEYGLERWLRALAAELARARSAVEELPQLADIERTPLAFLYRMVELYGTSLSPDLAVELARGAARVQPHLARLRGRTDAILAHTRFKTGQYAEMIFGKDRVIRFSELENGFSWNGRSFVTSSAGNYIDDSTANFEPDSLVGLRLAPNFNEYPITFEIIANTATRIWVAPATTDLSFWAPWVGPWEYQVVTPWGHSDDWRLSFYAATPLSVFNDKGLLIFLPSAITASVRRELARFLHDFKPATVSLLVLSENAYDDDADSYPESTTELDLTE